MNDLPQSFYESPFWQSARFLGSHDRPAMLFDWVFGRRMTDRADIAAATSKVWSGAHLPFRSLGADAWIQLFRMGGFAVDGVHASPPEAPMTLYRAAEPRYVHRLAWTASPDVANRFLEINSARYGDLPRFIYTITVTPDRLLARITDRKEDEFVTDTRGVKARRWVQS